MLAMSIGLPTRPAKCCVASGPLYSLNDVSIQPGDMELTRTRPARLAASACVSAAIPLLAVVEIDKFRDGARLFRSGLGVLQHLVRVPARALATALRLSR